MTETVRECYFTLRRKFRDISNEEFDAIFNGTLNLKYGQGPISEERECAGGFEKVRMNLEERRSGRAVEYIFGKARFMGFDFDIEEGLHIPKNSTETLVEKTLEGAVKCSTALDLCCGCGNIAISIALMADIKTMASDIDKKAVCAARLNAKRLNAQVEVIESDLFENIKGRFDIIVSNPPYVEDGQVLDNAVLGCGAKSLYAGPDGLDIIRKIILSAKKYLSPGGSIFLEIGFGQAWKVMDILKRANFREVAVHRDLSGIERVVEAKC